MKNLPKSLASELWRLFPHSFAERASGGSWKPYPYLRIIGNAIVEAVASGNGRLLVQLPPRHGKSELISRWTPSWFLSLFPDKSVILTSYEADFASRWGRLVRNEIQENPLISTRIVEDSAARSRWETDMGGGMVTAGVGGPITGRGASLIIIDDPVKNHEEAMSQTYRQRAIDWFQSTLYTRCEPNASIIVLMTRWHERDLAGWLEHEHADEWKVIRFPALAEDADPLQRPTGSALCPERFNEKKLELIRKGVGSRSWAALYQQRPSPEEGGILKRNWWKFYDQPPQDLQQLLISCDLAFKESNSSSYVVLQCWGKKGANCYLLDQVRQRMDFAATIVAIISFSKKWKRARCKLVEDKANGPAVISALKNRIEGLIAVEPRGTKEARAAAVSPIIEAGNVMLPSPTDSPWVHDFIEECAAFPNGAHDDQVDAMSQALDRLQRDGFSMASIDFSLLSFPRVSPWPS